MFGFLGRSHELKRLDQAVRAVGLHPILEAHAYDATVEMLGYCMLGPQGFTEANDLRLTEATEARLEAALKAGDSLDARLVLLALHAGVIQAQVVERYQLETD